MPSKISHALSGAVRFKDTRFYLDFYLKKDPSEAECWIHKTSLIPLSGHNS